MKSGVAVDLRYTNNCSFGLDMKILGLTCIEVVSKAKGSLAAPQSFGHR